MKKGQNNMFLVTKLLTFEERAELPDIQTAGSRELTQG